MTAIPRKPAAEEREPRDPIGTPLMKRAVDLENARCWLADNADAIKAENDYIEKHGLPLSKHRLF